VYVVVNNIKTRFTGRFMPNSHGIYSFALLSIVKIFYSKGLAPQYDFPNLPRLNGPTEFNGAGGVNPG